MMEENQLTQPTTPKVYKRISPQSELDLSLMTIDSVWGKDEVPQELREVLNKLYKTKNEKGEDGYSVKSMWGLLGYYTRDLRLANLSQWNGEMEYAQKFLDLANDFLQVGQTEPFLICLSRVATLLELSQSKAGFLRKRLKTSTEEKLNGETEPPKKNLWGAGKKE